VSGPAPAVAVLTAEQLRALVTEAVAAALDAREPAEPGPALLGAEQLAAALGTSPRTVRRLRSEGMPCSWLTRESCRYSLPDVVAWLASRGRP
jgi:hypothetical protein